jgi:two-component system OmpR family response regulator
MGLRLLLVEDEISLAQELAGMLRHAGFAVDICATAAEAREVGLVEPYDAVVLDLGLPDGDGLEVLAAWRARKSAIPVLILTARDRFSDLVGGFRAGADDFLTKPFRNEEVVLRLMALIRRSTSGAQGQIVCGELAMDAASGEITLTGLPLKLTSFERRVLRYLLLRRPSVVSRTELSEHIYESDTDRDFNSIEVIVSRLRRKIAPCRIQTVRGDGYRLDAGDDI